MGNQLEKKNLKFENLMTAAYELFTKKEVTAVSIDEIVKKAGVAKGTFYLYFQNKPDLITKLILKKANESLSGQGIHKEIGTEAEFDSAAEKILDYLTEFLEENKTLTKLIDKNVHICVQAVLDTSETAFRDLYDKITKYFIERGVPKDEIGIKMYIYLETVVSSCCNAILRGRPGDLEQVKANLYDIVTLSRYHIVQKREQKEHA